MTDSSVGSVADDTTTTIYGQLAHSPATHGLVEQSHDDSQRLQYLPHEAKVAVELTTRVTACPVAPKERCPSSCRRSQLTLLRLPSALSPTAATGTDRDARPISLTR